MSWENIKIRSFTIERVKLSGPAADYEKAIEWHQNNKYRATWTQCGSDAFMIIAERPAPLATRPTPLAPPEES